MHNLSFVARTKSVQATRLIYILGYQLYSKTEKDRHDRLPVFHHLN